MGQFGWHHAHLHAAAWLAKIDGLVQFDVLVLLYYAVKSVFEIDKFLAFLFDLLVSMRKINEFVSLDTDSPFEVFPVGFFLDAYDFDVFQ